MPTLFPLDNLLGAAEIGIIFSILSHTQQSYLTLVGCRIFGITILQVFLYYTEHCERDGLFMKAFVAAVLAFETVHVILGAMLLYHYTVTNYGDYTTLAKATWTLSLQIGLGSFSTFLVRLFYAYRIYRLSQNRVAVPLFIVAICIAACGICITITVTAFKRVYFARAPSILVYITAGLSLDVVADSIIAICTIYYLRQMHSSLRSTSRAVKKLITYSMNTCLLTTAVTFASLIGWRQSDQSLIGMGFTIVAIQLYGCSLMSVLNSRDGLRSDMGRSGTNVISLGGLISSNGASNPENGSADGVGADQRQVDGPGQTAKIVLIEQRPSMTQLASK